MKMIYKCSHCGKSREYATTMTESEEVFKTLDRPDCRNWMVHSCDKGTYGVAYLVAVIE